MVKKELLIKFLTESKNFVTHFLIQNFRKEKFEDEVFDAIIKKKLLPLIKYYIMLLHNTYITNL